MYGYTDNSATDMTNSQQWDISYNLAEAFTLRLDRLSQIIDNEIRLMIASTSSAQHQASQSLVWWNEQVVSTKKTYEFLRRQCPRLKIWLTNEGVEAARALVDR